MNFALRVYMWLARAFPHEFKMVYGGDVIQLGEDIMKETAERHGAAGVIRLLADIAFRLPMEYLSEARRDMRYALRAMVKSPGFTFVAIISTAIGIGLTTMVYTSRWQVITRNMPGAANASRVVMAEKPVSYYYIEQYRDQKNLFDGVAAFQIGVPFNITFEGGAKDKSERVFGQLISADYFSVLGVQAERGRVLDPAIDRPGDAPVVVITDRFWRNRLNSAPDAIGRTIRLNGQLATIVGITAKGFNGAVAISPSELFVPVTVPPALAPELANDVLHNRNARDFSALICLAPGVSADSAEAALDGLTRRIEEQEPSLAARNDQSRRVTLLSAGTMVPIPRKLKSVLSAFFIALMGLIMIIACMNLANMLLARGANRRKELAIRLAIGASRFRIVRQMISEGILLSLFGGAGGFGLAYLLALLSSRFTPPSATPTESNFAPDWHALGLVLFLSIVCGMGFSIVPALRATKTDLTPALKEGAAVQMPGYRGLGLRNLLMLTQIVGSLMLLLVTGFLVIGIGHVTMVRTNFDPHTMYLLCIDPLREGYSAERAQSLFAKLPAEIKNRALVDDVSLSVGPPFSIEGQDDDSAVQMTADAAPGSSPVQASATEQIIGADYFATLNEPLVAGREFTEQDLWAPAHSAKALPILINETGAREFFGSSNALGQHLRDGDRYLEVIGIAHNQGNGVSLTHAAVFLPPTQAVFARPPADGITVVMRSEAGSDALSAARREISLIDPTLTLFNVRTLNDYLDLARASERFAINTYGGIGVFGLVLAAIGLAGVTAYAVAQRRKEIGIRMALGASKTQVLLLVLREGAALVLAGTLLGFLGAFGLAKTFSSLTNVFVDALKVGTNDPRLLIGAPLLLAGLALLACYVPARRAAHIDPLKALRQE